MIFVTRSQPLPFYRPFYQPRPHYHYWHPLIAEEPSTFLLVDPYHLRNVQKANKSDEVVAQPASPASKEISNEVVDDNPFKAKVKLPDGMGADNLQLRVRNQVLTIVGEKRHMTANAVVTSSFSRQFPLLDDVDTDQISAVINPEGVLVVTAPRKPKAIDSAQSKPDSIPLDQPKSKEEDAESTTTPETHVVVPEKEINSTVIKAPALVPFQLQVTQNDDSRFTVTVQIPDGVSPDDFEIQVQDRVLSVSGKQRREIDGSVLTSAFLRRFVLDETVEIDKISAALDGEKRVLTVSAPRKPVTAKPAIQKIPIHTFDAAESDDNVQEKTTDKKTPTRNAIVDSTSLTADDGPSSGEKPSLDEKEPAALNDADLAK